MEPRVAQVFDLLWGEVAELQRGVVGFSELYGRPAVVAALNERAQRFFGLYQNLIFRDSVLALARLRDPAATGGRKNVTFETLLARLVATNRTDLVRIVRKKNAEFRSASEFAKEWRNKWYAHRDLQIAAKAKPLRSVASSRALKDGLESAVELMSTIELHYSGSQSLRAHSPHSGVLALLSALNIE